MNNCVICKEIIDHPTRSKCCTRVKCRIKFSYFKLAEKGYDPVLYYEQLIASKYQVRCKKCEEKFIARFKRDLFFPVCEKCENQEKEVFWPLIDEINKEAIEDATGIFLPSSVFESLREQRDKKEKAPEGANGLPPSIN